MPTAEPADASAAFDALVATLWADFERGALKPLDAYADAFAVDADRLREEYEAVAKASRPGADARPAEMDGPKRLGGYLLLRRLGRGGFADVWLGRRLDTGRVAALKLLGPRAGLSPYAVRKFAEETRITSQLEHPTICTVFEHGVSDDGAPWFAMEYVRGETLAAQIARQRGVDAAAATLHESLTDTAAPGRPSPRAPSSAPTRAEVNRIVALFEELADGLAAAHEARVVHRDVKPGNIMVRARDGRPVLLDFGLAIDVADDASRLTATQDLVGTYLYMAPERLDGGRVDDPRIDVWSLGLSLYEALTLEHPFRGATQAQTFDRIRRLEPPDARARNPQIGEDLATVVATAIRKNPAHRYATARDFADDLRAVRERRPIKAKPPGPLVRARLWLARNRTAAALGAAVVVALSAGLVSTLVQFGRFRRENVLRAAEAHRTTAAALGYAAANEAERNAPLAAIAAVAALDASARAGDAAPPEVVGLLLRTASQLREEAAFHDVRVASIGGRRLAWIAADGGARVFDADGTGATRGPFAPPDGGAAVGAGLSPDGARLAVFDAAGATAVYDAATGARVGSFAAEPDVVHVRPIGGGTSACVYVAGGATTWIDPDSGVRTALGRIVNGVMEPAVRGGLVVAADRERRLAWFDGRTGRRLAAVGVDDAVGRPAAPVRYVVAPEGRLLATAGRNPRLRLLAEGADEPAALAPPFEASSVACGPGGLVAFGQPDGTIRLGRARLDAEDELVFVETATIDDGRWRSRAEALAFSADGARLVAARQDGALFCYEAAGGRLLARYRGHRGPARLLGAFADGRIATDSADESTSGRCVRIWPRAEAEPAPPGLRALLPCVVPEGGARVELDAAGRPRVVPCAAGDALRAALGRGSPLDVVDPLAAARRHALAAAAGDGGAVAFAHDAGLARAWRRVADGAEPWGAAAGPLRRPVDYAVLGTATLACLAKAADGPDAGGGVYDLATGRRKAAWPDLAAANGLLAPSSRADACVVAGAGIGTVLYSGDDFGRRTSLDETPAVAAAYAPDGATIAAAYATPEPRLLLYGADGAVRARRPLPAAPRALAWSADGLRLTVAAEPRRLAVFDAALRIAADDDRGPEGLVGLFADADPAYVGLAFRDGAGRFLVDPARARAAARAALVAPGHLRRYRLAPEPDATRTP
jgi:serine/threonine protein kinase